MVLICPRAGDRIARSGYSTQPDPPPLDLGNQARTLRPRSRAWGMARGSAPSSSPPTIPTTPSAVADDVALMMPDGEIVQGPVGEMITPDLMSRLYGVPMHWARIAERETRRAMLPAFTGRDVA